MTSTFSSRWLYVCLLSLGASLTFAPVAQAQPVVTTTTLPIGTVGQAYTAQLTATGGAAAYAWTVGPGFPTGLNVDSSGLISGTPNESGIYMFMATVQSSDEFGSAELTIQVNDPPPPPLSIATATLPNGMVGSSYSQGLEAAGGVGPYTFSAQAGSLPPGLNVTGNELTGTPTATGTFTIQFQVVDTQLMTANKSLPIKIDPEPLAFPPTEFPPGTVGEAYTRALFATGGTPPYTFSASPATLPPGMGIVANQLSGTPTAAGTFPIDFLVTDSLGATAPRTIGMVVFPGPLTIITSTLPNGTVGILYNQTVAAAGGVEPYAFSANPQTLPPGLILNGVKLEGTPTTTGTFSIEFQVMDNAMTTAMKTIPVTIVAAGPSITTSTLPNGTVGVLYAQTLEASGGVPPYTFSADAGTLPPGLTVNTNQLSGTPATSGTFSVQFHVTDSQSGTANRTIPVTILPAALVITTSSLPAGTVGVAYSQALAASGGVAPYTFSAVAGTLPPGLSVNGNQLSGTPAAAGSFSIQFEVVDTQQVKATRTIPVAVQQPAPLQFITTALPEATIGLSYSVGILITGGDPPYALSAPANTLPPGLALVGMSITGTPTQAGNFSIPMELRDSVPGKPVVTRTFTLVVIAPSGPAPFQVHPGDLVFQTSEGNTEVTPQDLVVTSSNGEAPALSFTIPGAPAWLSVSYQPGTTPAQLRVRALPAHLPAGTFQAAVHVTVGEQIFDIPVTLIVAPAEPHIDVSPRIIQLTSQTLTPRGEALIVVRNNGGGPAIDVKAKAISASRWITGVNISTPRFTPAEPAYITLALDTTGLSPGAYRDEILIETGTGDFHVPVSLFIDGAGPVLDVSLQGIRLPARQGDAPTAQQTLEVRNQGSPASTVNWSASIIRGDDVFTLSSTAGSATSGSSSSITIGLKPNASAVAGGRSALLRIEDAQAANSPQYVVLVADVDPLGAPPQLEVSTAGLLFIGTAGGTAPDGQTFRFSAGGRSLNFQASTSTSDGANWLRVSPSSGVIPVAGSLNLRVSVETNGLPAGIYSGLVTTGVGTTVRGVGVTLIVVPSGATVPGQSLKIDSVQPRLAAGCTPARTALVQTTLAESFLVPAGWPATISAKLLNDCGEFLGDGAVIASFSNGDAPIVLEGDRTGGYTGTWQPGVAAASATVRVEGTRGTLQPAVLQIVGGVRANPLDPPALTSSGALNNFNPIAGGALAPGTITQISGTNLAPEPSKPTALPLPTSYQGVEVIVGGLSAPIFQVSKTQVTVQIPSELAPNQTHSMLLVTDAGYTMPVPLALVPVQPGMLLSDDGTVTAQHPDGSLVSSTSPALPGEQINIFLVGMGATTPSVASGTPAPPGATVNVGATVTIDDKPAQVISEGLVPGVVGLYQIQFGVPSDAPAGLRDIAITQDQIPANQAKLIVGVK